MGLDQRIWAEIESNGAMKQVAMHYWRKNYEIDEWFFRRLPEADRQTIEAEKRTVWCCDVTPVELELFEADEHSLAFTLDFDWELIWRCQMALEQGFTLRYSRDS